MALFKSIGNVFRRPEEQQHTVSSGEAGTYATGTLLGHGLSAKLLGPTTGQGMEESPDLYYEDRGLGESIHGLEEVRLALREVTGAANEHKEMLTLCANSERALGEALADVMEPGRFADEGGEGGRVSEYGDLDLGEVEGGRDENEGKMGHFSWYLPMEAREAQKALGRGLGSHSDATVKLSVAISSPINELTRSFEERYGRKIVPLRRRYIDQKGQYLKYKRNADMAENDEKRSYYEALAEAAKPVWMRTSTELRTESDVMTELTAKNLAKWSRAVALQHERALAIAAANFADAFNRAKTLPSLSRGGAQ